MAVAQCREAAQELWQQLEALAALMDRVMSQPDTAGSSLAAALAEEDNELTELLAWVLGPETQAAQAPHVRAQPDASLAVALTPQPPLPAELLTWRCMERLSFAAFAAEALPAALGLGGDKLQGRRRKAMEVMDLGLRLEEGCRHAAQLKGTLLASLAVQS